jgi:hypothetical protein
MTTIWELFSLLGLGSVVAVIGEWFLIKYRLEKLEKSFDDKMRGVVYEKSHEKQWADVYKWIALAEKDHDSIVKMETSMVANFDNIKASLKEIKEQLKHVEKRSNE